MSQAVSLHQSHRVNQAVNRAAGLRLSRAAIHQVSRVVFLAAFPLDIPPLDPPVSRVPRLRVSLVPNPAVYLQVIRVESLLLFLLGSPRASHHQNLRHSQAQSRVLNQHSFHLPSQAVRHRRNLLQYLALFRQVFQLFYLRLIHQRNRPASLLESRLVSLPPSQPRRLVCRPLYLLKNPVASQLHGLQCNQVLNQAVNLQARQL